MCGIGFCICSDESSSSTTPPFRESAKGLFLRRGPDACTEIDIVPAPGWEIHFAGAVLNLRGKTKGEVTTQPIVDQKGNVLLLNGEIYSTG